MGFSFAKSVASAAARAAALMWPDACACCDAPLPPGLVFCPTCAVSVEPAAPACPHCALPVGTPDWPSSCAGCRTDPLFPRARAAVLYGGSVRDAILRFKNGRIDLGRTLGGLLAPALGAALLDGANLVLPVPLHARKLKRRGFNPPLVLLEAAGRVHRNIGHGLPLPEIDPFTLERIRDDPDQGHRSRLERRLQVAGAVAVARGRGDRVARRHVLLVDDVVTTGATALACARALTEAGAARVDVLSLARTLP